MTNETELMSCPLCRGQTDHHTDAAFHHGDRGYKPKSEDFTCRKCGLVLRVRGDDITKEQAFLQWNTRADAQHVPEGFALVPLEPTAEMMMADATCAHHDPFDMTCVARHNRMRIWKAMTAAAPHATILQDGEY